MKSKLFQISWSEKSAPLNGCDFHPNLPLFATGNFAVTVGLWRVSDVRRSDGHDLNVSVCHALRRKTSWECLT
jgi:outer membrane phospholipase A